MQAGILAGGGETFHKKSAAGMFLLNARCPGGYIVSLTQVSRRGSTLVLRISIVAVILIGLAALLIAVSPSSRESMVEYFEGVDSTDKTPVLLRYNFLPGQELVFESSSEIVSTMGSSYGPGGGTMKIEARPCFKVVSVDAQGSAAMDVAIRKFVLETSSGFDRRRVEITPEAVHAYDRAGEIELSKEDRQVHKAIMQPFSISAGARGEVSLTDVPQDTDLQVAHFREALSALFFVLPQGEVAAGSKWDFEIPMDEKLLTVENPKVQCEFLGYKEYEGERCAVLKMSYSMKIRPNAAAGEEGGGPEGANVRGSVKFAGGLIFSMARGLPLVLFRRQDVSRTTTLRGGLLMHGSYEEDNVIKLIGASTPKK